MSILSKLKLRRKIKRKKPDYLRPYWWKKIAFRKDPDHWRRPKGIHNKIRKKQKGKPAPVETGYGSPKEVKGLLPNGLRPVLVHNVEELEGLDPNRDCVVIASTVGKRKRLQIIQKAQELGLKIWNLREEEKALIQGAGVSS